MALSRQLQLGMAGTDVQELQNILKTWGYNIGPYGADGQYGTDTANAVKAFQKDAGLNPDGVVGNNTLEVLARAGVIVGTVATTSVNKPKTIVPIQGATAGVIPIKPAGGINWTMIGIIAAVIIAAVVIMGDKEE